MSGDQHQERLARMREVANGQDADDVRRTLVHLHGLLEELYPGWGFAMVTQDPEWHVEVLTTLPREQWAGLCLWMADHLPEKRPAAE